MLKDKDLDRFIEDLYKAEDAPKWISKYRRTYYKDRSLPFLIVYQSVGIMRAGHSKSAAIAIATAQLQKSGLLLEGSNTLSLTGDIREIAEMTELGMKTTKQYVQSFDAS